MTLAPEVYQDLVGKPYLERGRDVATGLDCFGVVLEVYKRLGVPLADPYVAVPKTYGSDGDPGDHQWLLKQLFGDWNPVELQGGAVVAFSRYGKRPDHAGVMINDRLFIHAIHHRLADHGEIVISDLKREPFVRWFVGAYGYSG